MSQEESFYKIFAKFLPAMILCIIGISVTIFLLYKKYIDNQAALHIMGIVLLNTMILIAITVWRLKRSADRRERQ